jgi:hypothetical protein
MEDPKKAYGAQKPSMHFVPMNVMIGVARVFELGAKKYGLKNWRKQPVSISTYYDAIHRHLTMFFEVGVDLDQESKQHHLDHVIANCMIIRDGVDRKSIIDDRKDVEVKTGPVLGGAPQRPGIMTPDGGNLPMLDHDLEMVRKNTVEETTPRPMGYVGKPPFHQPIMEHPADAKRREAGIVDVEKLLNAVAEEDVIERKPPTIVSNIKK